MSSGLADLFRRGGFYYGLPGASPAEILSELTGRLQLPESVDREKLLAALLEREELMSTAAGGGIALPHPRNPVAAREDEQFAALAFPERPVDWGALDDRSAAAVILIVSASPRLHLRTLQQVSFFCHDEHFRFLLNEKSSPENILAYIEKTESAWRLP